MRPPPDPSRVSGSSESGAVCCGGAVGVGAVMTAMVKRCADPAPWIPAFAALGLNDENS